LVAELAEKLNSRGIILHALDEIVDSMKPSSHIFDLVQLYICFFFFFFFFDVCSIFVLSKEVFFPLGHHFASAKMCMHALKFANEEEKRRVRILLFLCRHDF
jgi:hypothetical protein